MDVREWPSLLSPRFGHYGSYRGYRPRWSPRSFRIDSSGGFFGMRRTSRAICRRSHSGSRRRIAILEAESTRRLRVLDLEPVLAPARSVGPRGPWRRCPRARGGRRGRRPRRRRLDVESGDDVGAGLSASPRLLGRAPHRRSEAFMVWRVGRPLRERRYARGRYDRSQRQDVCGQLSHPHTTKLHVGSASGCWKTASLG
jgi:hypothetical protein